MLAGTFGLVVNVFDAQFVSEGVLEHGVERICPFTIQKGSLSRLIFSREKGGHGRERHARRDAITTHA